ncbi:ribonuclease HII [Aestuariibaculum lutulentum]|uniref:Ribonuclease HII n=1 Tax=Aestuariibaculum lutulentum TaxID=2920935 RepID=A0ABS9RNB3_9FLAO|nr:ribonuclease HII [Aestuariibaculum lutulentum]MCH4554066.1 ribonuclease HII [Aestuariibaculum lutulentum]
MRFFCFSLLLCLTFSCTNTKTNRQQPIDYIPENTSVVLKTSNLESLKSSINNSDLLQKFSKTNPYNNLESKLESVSLLKPKSDVLICFSNTKADSLEFTVITKYHDQLVKTDSLPNYKEETIAGSKQKITKSTFNKSTFYSTVIDSMFIASSSKTIIDAAFNNDRIPNSELEKIYNTTSNDRTLSALVKADNPIIKSLFIEDTLSLKAFTNYLAVDIDVSQNEIYVNGISKANDSTESLINIFKNTVPQENQIQNITPSNTDGFLSFTFRNFENLKTNLQAYKKQDSIDNNTELFNNIIEVGVIYQDNDRAVVLNTIDVIATEDALISEQNTIDTFRETEIYSFSKPDVFSKTFSPLITFNNASKYCILDNFFVFADNMDLLQNIITNYQNKTTLSEKDVFIQAKEQLVDASSLMLVANPTTLKQVISQNFDEELNINLDHYNISALQFIYDNNFAHVNGIIKKGKARAEENAVSEELNIKLDNDILTDPQFVKNHITGEKEIVVQDIKNNLYLISNKGKILWKKELQGAVLGTIEQIDIYKNGRLQLAFATPNRVYVIDRNGKDVSPFPMKFNDKITQPLAVFDYDKNKNYRLLVTQGKHVLMYNDDAKEVKGFTFKSANNSIITTPKHFRIGSKDYIAIKTADKLYILDRTGKTRVTPKTGYSYSTEPVFEYNNTFTTTGVNGHLISVDTKGNVASRNLNLSEKHSLTTSTKSLVAQSENKLTIKNKTIELDYGNYTAPGFFYLNDKIYISITDLQTHKAYLFDSQAKLLPNFPVYGNSPIQLDNINKDRNLEFVTKGESNSILLYQLN